MPDDSAAQILRILSVRRPQFDETLRIFCIVLEVALLDAPGVEADLPATVEDDLLVLVLVDVAEVDSVEVLEEILEADPEAAVVKCLAIQLSPAKLFVQYIMNAFNNDKNKECFHIISFHLFQEMLFNVQYTVRYRYEVTK